MPTGKADVVRVAVPSGWTLPDPIALPSCVKLTVPVGVAPEPLEGATVAVKVTAAPACVVGAEDLRVVVEGAVDGADVT